jgi:hypothetical protein
MNWTRLLALGWAAKRGVDVYHNTADNQAAVRTTAETFGALWLICLGASCVLLFGFLSVFWLGFLVGVAIGAFLTWLGIWTLRRTLHRANVLHLPQAPPPIP